MNVARRAFSTGYRLRNGDRAAVPAADTIYGARRATLLEIIEERTVRLPDLPGCWLYEGTYLRKGYGVLHAKLVHRLALTERGIPIPKGMYVLHRCDVPACVRPDHLYIGTNSDNQYDRWRRFHRREEQRLETSRMFRRLWRKRKRLKRKSA